jgi:hypothetical protein
MAIAIDSCEIEADVPTCLTTTLYDLMAALQDVVAPHEDALVVGLVARWLRTGRITFLGDAASRRHLRRSATLALCRWGFHPPLTTGAPLPFGNSRLRGLNVP